MKILILGGTGAMGRPLSALLSEKGHSVTVTGRSESGTGRTCSYRRGNGKDRGFLSEILNEERYDAVVDFLSYTTEEFRERYRFLLSHTEHYVFLSSARVFADCPGKITEKSPQLLDVTKDRRYLKTDEYALAKARQERLLRTSGLGGWTIVRPSVTSCENRLQLGVLEKESWLYRALKGRSVVFSEDLLDRVITVTMAEDAARGIAGILLNPEETRGRDYNLVSGISYTWREILSFYLEALEEKTGRRPPLVITEKSVRLKLQDSAYELFYSRYFDRRFDNRKILPLMGGEPFRDPKEGLKEAVSRFLDHPEFKKTDWGLEGFIDREAGEKTPLGEIPSFRDRAEYICCRYGLDWFYRTLRRMKRGNSV